MDTLIVTLVDVVVVPVTSLIPFLASSGILLAVFAVAWSAFAVALIRDGASLACWWGWIRTRPLLVQGVAWLLFLPVLAGLRVWRTSWPLAGRLAVIGGIAGWNLLVMVPRPA